MQLKTINITKREFENNLINLIQNSNMPACILVDIFEKYTKQLEDIAESNYQRDLQQLQKQEQEQQEVLQNESSQN